MRVNIERLKNDIEGLGKIGYEEGKGVTRESYTPIFEKGQKFVLGLMKNAGLKVRMDPAGNIFGRREGKTNGPPILFGSHLDTVRQGGKFDGALGVVSAIECIRVFKENNITTECPLQVIAFTAEEGGGKVYGLGTFGSRTAFGKFDFDDPVIKSKMELAGVDIEAVKKSVVDPKSFKCFLEYHIEQGAILDSSNIPVGIVTGIVHIERHLIKVKGHANHAGTTPMKLRDDALIKACKFIQKVNELALDKGEDFVATVGKIEIIPGAVNVIPGEVIVYVEVRSLDDAKLRKMEEEIREYAEVLGNIDVSLLTRKRGVYLDKSIQNVIEETCKELGYDYKYIESGAGHDAMTVGNDIPTAMIFSPSVNGISHNKDEFTHWQDIEKGANVLLNTILKLQSK